MWKSCLKVALLGLGLVACGRGEEFMDERLRLGQLEQKAVQTVGPLQLARYQHCSAKLPDGKVLFIGGRTYYNDAEGTVTTEVYDPVAKTTAFRASMQAARISPTCLALRDGTLLVLGGTNNSLREVFVERYTPSTDTWTSLSPPPSSLFSYGMSAVQLDDGRVLVTGGVHAQSGTYLLDLGTNSWTSQGSLNVGRMNLSLVKLPTGRVLALGGFGAANSQRTLEVYTPATGTWSVLAAMPNGSSRPVSVLLPDGRVFVGNTDNYESVSSPQLFDVSTNTWTLLPQPTGVHGEDTKLALLNGQPVVVGGSNTYIGGPMLIERFDIAQQLWTTLGQLSIPRDLFTLDVLQDDTLLIAGGGVGLHSPGMYEAYAPMELLTPDAIPPSTVLFTYSGSNTNNASQNTTTRFIKLNAGEQLQVGTCNVPGASASGDTYLRLLDGYSEVASNDDSCGGSASFIQYTATTTGTYELYAGCYSNSRCSGTVTFRIIPATLAPLSYSGSNTNNAQQNTTNRIFTLKAGDVLEVGTCNVPGSSATGDTYLRLFGGGTQVAYNDDSCGGSTSFIQYTAPSAGAYELHAGCYANTNCGGTVTFRITPAKK